MNKISSCIIYCFLGFASFNLNSREFGESFDEKFSTPELTLDEVIAENNTLKTKVLETTPASPVLIEKKWFVNWDILFWHPKVGGTSFAFINDRASMNLPIQGYTKFIPFKWNFGFRAGLGRYFEHDKWSGFLNFTYFKSTDSVQMSGSAISYITPLRGVFSHYALKAKSTFDFSFYNLDADLYRHYFISHGISLKPSIGLKNTWVDLKQVVRYNDGSYLKDNTAQTIDTSKVWGIGPKAGFESSWYLNHGFNVFGLFSASLIYGYFQVEEDSKITPTSENDFIIRDSFHRFIPNVQFYLGLGYGTYFKDDRYFLDLKLGYECQYYWRMNQMISLQRFDNSYRYANISEDVSLHGVTLKIKLSF